MHKIQRSLLKLAKTKNLGNLTLREIAEQLGESELHPQQVKHHLTQLQKKGLITVDRDKDVIERVRFSTARRSPFVSVPIVGSANCGEALELADEHVEGFLKVSRSMLKRKRGIYALRAVGSSMNKAKVQGQPINDGDYVIIDGDDREPEKGDYVVSIIESAANVKKFVQDADTGEIALISESTDNFPPIYIHPHDFADYMISGKVVQVIKNPSSV